jgi:hypothetical protein
VIYKFFYFFKINFYIFLDNFDILILEIIKKITLFLYNFKQKKYLKNNC